MSSLVAVVSDLHVGSTIGLCPEDGVDLDDGGRYGPSKAQKWLWEKWLAYWDRVKQERRGRDLYVVFNGDLVDGDHHNTPQIISRNPATARRQVMECLKPVLSVKPEHIFVVRGTETHVGKSGANEEDIAEALGSERDSETGAYSWWRLPIEVEGVFIDFTHHGRMGHRPWTKANPVLMLAAEITQQTAKERTPDLAIRSHYHKWADSADNYPVRVIQLGAWQLATAYVHRIAPGAEPRADIGGLLIECEGGGYQAEKVRFRPERRKPWSA